MATKTESGSLQALAQALAQASPPSVVCILGSEAYLRDRAVEMIKSSVLLGGFSSMNFDRFVGKEAAAASILAAVKTLPMMAKVRLVLVQEADAMPAEEANSFIPYLEQPSASTCLCLVAEALDQRTKWFMALKKHAFFVKTDPLTERQLPDFVKECAKNAQLSLTADAISQLIETVGADLGQLHQSIERVAHYVGLQGTAQPKDIEALVPNTRVQSVFKLVDALGANDIATSLRVLHTLLETKEPALRLLALVVRHVRQLWVLQDALARTPNLSYAQAAQVAGVPPFAVGKLMDQARRLSKLQVEKMHEHVYQTDRALKRSRLNDAHHLELLVLALCKPA